MRISSLFFDKFRVNCFYLSSMIWNISVEMRSTLISVPYRAIDSSLILRRNRQFYFAASWYVNCGAITGRLFEGDLFAGLGWRDLDRNGFIHRNIAACFDIGEFRICVRIHFDFLVVIGADFKLYEFAYTVFLIDDRIAKAAILDVSHVPKTSGISIRPDTFFPCALEFSSPLLGEIAHSQDIWKPWQCHLV